MFKYFALLIALIGLIFASAETFIGEDYTPKFTPVSSNATAASDFVYHYEIKKHHFYGPHFSGSGTIDTTSACSGYNNSCRNNPSCTCKKNEGPLPPGTYTIGNMFTYKGYKNSYALYPYSSNNMCGRSDFLIHGGNCNSGNPSIGCIVIPDENERYKIKSGGTLIVVN